MTVTVADICRYPVKGLNAESLDRVALTAGQGLPHDRRFAIAHGSTRFDREAPQWLAKTNFFMLMRDEKLALLLAYIGAGLVALRLGPSRGIRGAAFAVALGCYLLILVSAVTHRPLGVL